MTKTEYGIEKLEIIELLAAQLRKCENATGLASHADDLIIDSEME